MTMTGEPMLLNPKIRIPQWDPLEDQAAAFASFYVKAGGSASFFDSPTAAQRYLLSNELEAMDFDFLGEEDGPAVSVDAFSGDDFRMFEFKVRTCARGRSHDWTKCPYAHSGEKARRRDPRRYQYSGTECPELRQGSCRKGDSCEFAHGVFESWLHPDRYRTQPCRDGMSCRRRVCFFAHSSEQLRIPSKQSLKSPRAKGTSVSSPTSVLISPSISPSSNSPPMSPNSPGIGSESFASASELLTLMRNLQLGDSKDIPRAKIISGYGSPRVSSLRPPISMPSTPTGNPATSGLGTFELWDKTDVEEEQAMERVESGRDLRAQMYAKLMKDNSLERVGSYHQPLISTGYQG